MRVLVVLVAIAAAGCLRQTQFQCANDSSCGAGGQCEASGFCSFADDACTSGRRYSSSAGDLAGQCTTGTPIDSGVDVPGAGDSGIDTPAAGCPAGYNALPGITNGHVYRLVTAADNWDAQQAFCKLTTQSAYLAVPDDLAELTALDTLAGAIAEYWVGINDKDAELAWVNVLGAVQTFLPWQPPAPDNAAGGQGEDCVLAISATHTFNDVRCQQTSLPAICECVP